MQWYEAVLERVRGLFENVPGWVKRLVPIAGSILILYYYFHDQDWAGIWRSLVRADMALALAAMCAPQFLFWAMEVLFAERHFRWFHAPFPWRRYLWVRGAIYVLQLLNTVAGAGGGMLAYLKSKTGVSWWRLLGIMFFRFSLTLWSLCFFLVAATAALYHYDLADQVNLNMRGWWALLALGLLSFTLMWLFWMHNKAQGIARLVVRDPEDEFWTAFRLARKRHWLYTWAMALPPFLVMLLGFYFSAMAFGINVPFVEFMVLSPLFVLVMDLPIAFAGFGTTTMAWMVFFGQYGSPEGIAALTIYMPFARAATRAFIGLISLPPAMDDLATLAKPEKNH